MDYGQIGGGLIVAAVSGLGFLAVKFPATLNDLRRAFIAIFLLFFVAGVAHDYAVIVSAKAMLPFIPKGQLLAAEKVRAGLMTPNWLIWSFNGLGAYLIFLEWLTVRLAREKNEKEEKDRAAK